MGACGRSAFGALLTPATENRPSEVASAIQLKRDMCGPALKPNINATMREYDKLARTCAVEKANFPNYLLRLTELELLDRDRRAIERRIRQAKFPVVKSLDSFDFLATSQAPVPALRLCGKRLIIRGNHCESPVESVVSLCAALVATAAIRVQTCGLLRSS